MLGYLHKNNTHSQNGVPVNEIRIVLNNLGFEDLLINEALITLQKAEIIQIWKRERPIPIERVYYDHQKINGLRKIFKSDAYMDVMAQETPLENFEFFESNIKKMAQNIVVNLFKKERTSQQKSLESQAQALLMDLVELFKKYRKEVRYTSAVNYDDFPERSKNTLLFFIQLKIDNFVVEFPSTFSSNYEDAHNKIEPDIINLKKMYDSYRTRYYEVKPKLYEGPKGYKTKEPIRRSELEAELDKAEELITAIDKLYDFLESSKAVDTLR